MYNFDTELYNLLEEYINENIPYMPKDILKQELEIINDWGLINYYWDYVKLRDIITNYNKEED